eukprot:3941393-Rhodomonas_salina.1
MSTCFSSCTNQIPSRSAGMFAGLLSLSSVRIGDCSSKPESANGDISRGECLLADNAMLRAWSTVSGFAPSAMLHLSATDIDFKASTFGVANKNSSTPPYGGGVGLRARKVATFSMSRGCPPQSAFSCSMRAEGIPPGA